MFLAGVEGIEPSPAVLETDILPLNYTPKSITFYLYKIIDISIKKYLVIIWWAFRDLNPGPTGYEPGALTNCAKGPNYWRRKRDLNPRIP